MLGCDENSEQAVIGSVLIDPSYVLPRLAKLQPEHFQMLRNRIIWQAIRDLKAQDINIDQLTIAAELDRIGKLDQAGGIAYLGECFNTTVSAVHAQDYARAVLKAAHTRHVKDLAEHAVTDLANGTDPAKVSFALAQGLKLTTGETVTETTGDITAHLLEQAEQWKNNPLKVGEVRWLDTGIKDFNRLTGGLKPSLYISGAHTSVGKTSLWLSVACNVAAQDRTVAYFTAEMTEEQLISRAASSIARVDIDELEAGRLKTAEYRRYIESVQRLGGYSGLHAIYHTDITDIIGDIYELASRHLDLVVVDYINLLHGGEGENRNQRFGSIAKALLEIAHDKDVYCPIVLLAQLNRSGDRMQPDLSDLRDSGELEQIADGVLMLARDTETDPRELHVIKRKWRLGGGQNQAVKLYFGKYAEVADGYQGN